MKSSSQIFKLEVSTLQKVCKGIDTPRSLAVSLLAKNQEWTQLVGLTINPEHYDSPGAFADDYLVTSMLKKSPRVPLGIDLREVAIAKWLSAEERCAETNAWSEAADWSQVPHDVISSVHRARNHVSRILGPLGSRELDFVEKSMRFGPGATTTSGGNVTLTRKYSRRKIEGTPSLSSFAESSAFPHMWEVEFEPSRASRLTTVPKSAKEDRCICIEPDLNIYVQLGIGALLKSRLKAVGLDLRSQAWNQWLAQNAARLSLCTMDLSSASDTISWQVVNHLLPERWTSLLGMARTPATSLPDGRVVELEKWSSMGNGYTFELETLIFYSTLLGCCDHLGIDTLFVTAYGDDLVIPLSVAPLVERTLKFLGFSVNREKTFGEGRFHESCGTDWFDGVNVRPVFFKKELDNEDLVSICYLYGNLLRRCSLRRHVGRSCDRRILPAWIGVFTTLPPRWRKHIPEGYGDVGFISNFDEATPAIRYVQSPQSPRERKHSRGFDGYGFTYLSRPPVKYPVLYGTYLATLAGQLLHTTGALRKESAPTWVSVASSGRSHDLYDIPTPGGEAMRGRVQDYRTKRGHVFTWPNLGPWS